MIGGVYPLPSGGTSPGAIAPPGPGSMGIGSGSGTGSPGPSTPTVGWLTRPRSAIVRPPGRR